jgi:hypothetical protein
MRRSSWLSTVAGLSPFLVKETHVSMGETSLPGSAHLAGGVHNAAHPPPQTPALLAAAERRRRHEVWSTVYTEEGPQVRALKPADMQRFVPEVGSGEGVRINDAVCQRLGYYPHFNPVLAHALLQRADATRVAGAGAGAGGHIGEGTSCEDASSTSTSMRAALTAYYTPWKSLVFGGAVRTELGCAGAGMRGGGGGAGDVHTQVQQERETAFDLAFQTLFQANVKRQGWSLQEGGGGGGGGGSGGGGGTLPRKEPLVHGVVKREGWSLQEGPSSSLLHSGAGRRDGGEGSKWNRITHHPSRVTRGWLGRNVLMLEWGVRCVAGPWPKDLQEHRTSIWGREAIFACWQGADGCVPEELRRGEVDRRALREREERERERERVCERERERSFIDNHKVTEGR